MITLQCLLLMYKNITDYVNRSNISKQLPNFYLRIINIIIFIIAILVIYFYAFLDYTSIPRIIRNHLVVLLIPFFFTLTYSMFSLCGSLMRYCIKLLFKVILKNVLNEIIIETGAGIACSIFFAICNPDQAKIFNRIESNTHIIVAVLSSFAYATILMICRSKWMLDFIRSP